MSQQAAYSNPRLGLVKWFESRVDNFLREDIKFIDLSSNHEIIRCPGILLEDLKVHWDWWVVQIQKQLPDFVARYPVIKYDPNFFAYEKSPTGDFEFIEYDCTLELNPQLPKYRQAMDYFVRSLLGMEKAFGTTYYLCDNPTLLKRNVETVPENTSFSLSFRLMSFDPAYANDNEEK